jgi:hypothetical protein
MVPQCSFERQPAKKHSDSGQYLKNQVNSIIDSAGIFNPFLVPYWATK